MTLAPDTRLGPFQVLGPLGAGGMGEVYRARDTRLDRTVAIKVLPGHLSAHPELRERLDREARAISALSHPHICVLYDVGHQDGLDYLVMEHLEGETLAHRLARGPLPPEQVIRFGIEMADALDKAHRGGIVHRDFKPGNVMLTKTGAKLMDFGLARAAAATPSPRSVDLTASPTLSRPLTQEGSIVGTFQYMAPEQLEGRDADARSDVWALGVVLYEMVTGRKAFSGGSQASLISAIMKDQPRPMTEFQPLSPPALEAVVRQCLAKDPEERIQSAHDVKLQLEWLRDAGSQAGAPAAVTRGRRRRGWLAWGSAAAALLAIGMLGVTLTRGPRGARPVVRARVAPPPGVEFSATWVRPLPLAISPDGATLVFCGRQGEGHDLLWVRPLAAEDARALPGTESAESPFFSPDGRSIAFFVRGALKRVDVAGGPVTTVCEVPDQRGGTWGSRGVILFSSGSAGVLHQVAAAGGTPVAATVLDSSLREVTHRYPHFLPDGRHFLYLARRAASGPGQEPTIYAGELGSPRRVRVMDVASNVAYADGRLFYVREGVLVAQRFDTRRLAVSGQPVPLIEDARMDERYSRGVFAVSPAGVLVGMTGKDRTRTQLRWMGRDGSLQEAVGEPADYFSGGSPMISPDGGRAAMAIVNAERGTSDIWIVDLASGLRRRLTVDGRDHYACTWTPDGKVLMNTQLASGEMVLHRRSADGTGGVDSLHHVPGFFGPVSASPDGRAVLLNARGDLNPRGELSLLTLGPPGTLTTLEPRGTNGQFSPDGRFIAFVSRATGRPEVFVAAYPQTDTRWQVSQNGGSEPRWRSDGRELFYVDGQNRIVAAEVGVSGARFDVGASRPLFQVRSSSPGGWRYDVAPGGQRFLVCREVEAPDRNEVVLLANWPAMVRGR